MDRRRRFKLPLEIFRDIMKICPRVQVQDFDALPTDEEIMSFLRELRHNEEFNSLNDITGLDKLCLSREKNPLGPEMKETKAYKTNLSFASRATPPKMARKFKKPASPQLSTVLVSYAEPTKKSKRVKRYAKKSTKAPSGGIVIRETSEMP
nr:hypothetical protein [Tanacetum cinerariifolium]